MAGGTLADLFQWDAAREENLRRHTGTRTEDAIHGWRVPLQWAPQTDAFAQWAYNKGTILHVTHSGAIGSILQYRTDFGADYAGDRALGAYWRDWEELWNWGGFFMEMHPATGIIWLLVVEP